MTSNMYPDNILGLMFRILDAVMSLCNSVVQHLSSTPLEILETNLENSNLPEWLSNALVTVIDFLTRIPSAALVRNLTLFDLLIGTGILIILVFGIIKFFGDGIGL